ncbi:MAG: DUF1059 domain-containing protein [bacterium]
MADEQARVIECPCGAVIEGKGTEDVVSRAQTHAKETHDMNLSDDQALAMARPA